MLSSVIRKLKMERERERGVIAGEGAREGSSRTTSELKPKPASRDLGERFSPRTHPQQEQKPGKEALWLKHPEQEGGTGIESTGVRGPGRPFKPGRNEKPPEDSKQGTTQSVGLIFKSPSGYCVGSGPYSCVHLQVRGTRFSRPWISSSTWQPVPNSQASKSQPVQNQLQLLTHWPCS